ncbi:MAG: hypothetical protein AUH78_00605 [Gemmatimonadetes bacterium 13_1_40CM_4_69_8]|nr:MAG: hypothetical protein AUH78_00605 [Gemmatimonadetes bacterium 13_1_40CM_4_69_8]
MGEGLETLEIFGDEDRRSVHVENLEDLLVVHGVEPMDQAAHVVDFVAGCGVEGVHHDHATGGVDRLIAGDSPLRQALLEPVLCAEFVKGHGRGSCPSAYLLINLRESTPCMRAQQARYAR